jgi:nucleoside-diphosphate-sugar epimerase
MERSIAIAGASGVIGASAVEAFARAGWDVVALSRRRPVLPAGVAFRHLPLDFADAARCAAAVGEIGAVGHLVYAAVAEAPGLVGGWSDPALIETNRRMFANLATPLAATGALRWVGLLQGTKAYGAHLHPIALPAREDGPRDPHANFYWEHEDCLRALAQQHGFDWTIFRPQVVFGGAPGAVMNPVVAIGAYAALCRELRRRFDYPASGATMWEITDASLLAEALLWATDSPSAVRQTFNVTNGDVFVLQHDCPRIADRLGLAPGEARPGGIAALLSGEDAASAWRSIAARYQLRIDDLGALLGQSHHYVDLLLSERIIQAGGLPTLVSGIKIRKAGFSQCRDSLESLLFWLRRMSETGLLPSDLIGENIAHGER